MILAIANEFRIYTGRRDILSLTILCDNSLKGCEWVGELRSLDGHLVSCGFTLLPCPNKCCKDRKCMELLRKDLEKHLVEECPRRQYSCPHCQEVGEYQERTTTHLEECPMKEVPCPKRQCMLLIPRCDLSKHRLECPFEEVFCKYKSIGCEEKILRKDLERHERDTQQHLQVAIDTVHLQQSILAHLQAKCAPVTYKFTKYAHHKAANDRVYSPSFYTSRGGYRMCISVDANGTEEGTGTHISVYAYLEKGENDSLLPWPFTGKVTVELLNQLDDRKHHSRTIKFLSDRQSTQGVVDNERYTEGWGRSCYISHSDLGHNPAKNRQYLKDDCLYFRISVDARSSSKPWLIRKMMTNSVASFDYNE